MSRSLRDEIHQGRPFKSLEQEAYLNLVRTAAILTDSFEQIIKPAGITLAQYNVLRILRGAEPEGLCRNELRDRMLTRMPDMTRLLDRMEVTGLVKRERESADRRMVRSHSSAKGRRLLDQLEVAVAAEHQRRLGHVSRTDLRKLIDSLSRMRR